MAGYGCQLSKELQYPGDEPFADQFPAYSHFFNCLLNEGRDAGLEYFRQRAQSVDAHTMGTLAMEVYIDLLARCGRADEAIEATLTNLPPGTHTTGTAPSLLELSTQRGDFDVCTCNTRSSTRMYWPMSPG